MIGRRKPCETPSRPRRPWHALVASAVVVLFALLALAGCEAEPSPLTPADGESYGTAGTNASQAGLRDYYTNVGEAKSATVMVYMCGADLESAYGCASSDIEEMLAADLGDSVNVVVETGGADEWWLDGIDASVRQRWHVQDGSLVLDGDTGQGTMLDAGEVTDFVRWGAEAYPADRYMLVFWDHGGGTVGGFGADERYPEQPALSLVDLRQAISDSGQKIDIVGFDACLMGTIETAYALEPCADYLLASEEIEPGDGWAWTDFLTLLGADPATPSVEVGTCAVNSFTKHYFELGNDAVTLSLVDLREVPAVYESLGTFLQAAQDTISADNSRFGEMSKARANARAYCEGSIDQVDLADLAARTSFEGKDDLLQAVGSCVKYRSLTSLDGSNGLATYFPYSEVEYYTDMRTVLSDMDYTEPTEFYDYFLSVMGNSGGTTTTGPLASVADQDDESSAESSAPSTDDYANDSYSDQNWFDTLLDFDYEQTPDELYLTETADGFVVDMDDAMWSTMSDFYITVLEEYEDGYLMLGSDNVYDVTDDDDIVVSYDGQWLCLNGELVSFFCAGTAQSASGENIYTGTIPALLNGGTRIDIVVSWPPASEQGDEFVGRVQGYRRDGAIGSGSTFGRLASFAEGDTITPLFDYYDSDGNWDSTIEGTQVTVDDPDQLSVTYEDFEHDTNIFWGTMTDIYGDQVDTETLTQ